MADSIRVAAEQARVALKPCPFCGSTAELIDRPHGPLLVGAFVQCPECAAAQPIVKTAEEAIEAWNHRASLEAALAALPGDKGQEQNSAVDAERLAYALKVGQSLVHPAATPAVESSQIAGRDGASAAPAQASSYAALTSPGVPSAARLPSLSQTDESALPRTPTLEDAYAEGRKDEAEELKSAAKELRGAMGISQDFSDWPIATLMQRAAIRFRRIGESQPTMGGSSGWWAIFDSEGFYEARETEGQASRFCEKYNAREGDPLKPYSYRMAERRIENVPMCPACGHSLTDDEMHGHLDDLWALAPDEGRAEIACPACGVTYHCQGGYRPEYKTALDEDDL